MDISAKQMYKYLRNGDVERSRIAIANGFDINTISHQSEYYSDDIMLLLFQSRPDKKTRTQLIDMFCSHGDMFIDDYTNYNDKETLIICVKRGRFDLVEFLLKKVVIDAEIISELALNGYFNADTFLNLDIDIHSNDDIYLRQVTHSRNVVLIKTLLLDKCFNQPKYHEMVLDIILKDVNKPNIMPERTAHIDDIILLLIRLRRIDVKRNNNELIQYVAKSVNNKDNVLEMIKSLVNLGADINVNKSYVLNMLVYRCFNYDEVLFSLGTVPNEKTLELAIMYQKEELINKLLENGIVCTDLNFSDAIKGGNINIINLLKTSNRVEFGERSMKCSIIFENFDLIKYFGDLFGFSQDLLAVAGARSIMMSDIRYIKYFIEEFDLKTVIDLKSFDIMASCIEDGTLNVLEYLISVGIVLMTPLDEIKQTPLLQHYINKTCLKNIETLGIIDDENIPRTIECCVAMEPIKDGDTYIRCVSNVPHVVSTAVLQLQMLYSCPLCRGCLEHRIYRHRSNL